MIISSRTVAGIAGILVISAPIAESAAAAAALAGTFAMKLLDEAFGNGVSGALDLALGAAFGTETQVVDLSEAAYERIAEIVDEVVSNAFYDDYTANFDGVVTDSKDYNRDANDIDKSIQNANNVLNDATDSVSEMMLDSVGLKGTVMFMVVSSLKLGFYEELRQLEELDGDSAQALHWETRHKETAAEYLAHMWTLLDLWVAARDSMYSYYWRDAGQHYDGWYTRKYKRKCYKDQDNDEVCSDNRWECKCAWTADCSAFGKGWKCSGYDSVEDNIEAKRTAQLTSDRSEVLGDNFGDYMQTLADINGATVCPEVEVCNNPANISCVIKQQQSSLKRIVCMAKVYGST